MKNLMAAIMLSALAVPCALAGPAEDTELAEKEFARGDLVASLGLWRKAAQQGYAPAQARLGDILDKAEEDTEAVEWYRKAAAQGNAAGEYGLGQMYAKGEGVKKDPEQARLHILKAAEKSYLAAVILMMEAYRTGGLGLAVDHQRADIWEAKLISLSPGYQRTPAKASDQSKKAASK
ncbi:tetratricopeptide repeat protein [Rhodoferax sp.]|uniref:tetratricopeptide repeat protein n=1 Tax=Rhodoferax sp. TaxID=50421 RepID=UPI0027694597|nr:tetratricopeptide repeat protein [Rhodoferax sp.]